MNTDLDNCNNNKKHKIAQNENQNDVFLYKRISKHDMTTMNQIKLIYCFTDKEVSNLLSTGTCKACPEKQ